MIVLVATLRVHPGKGEAYEAIFRALKPKVMASEPGMVWYDVARSRDEPNTYRAVEVYRDDAAMTAHAASPHLKAVLPDMLACFAGDILIQLHDSVAPPA